jgi:hypothetical protein
VYTFHTTPNVAWDLALKKGTECRESLGFGFGRVEKWCGENVHALDVASERVGAVSSLRRLACYREDRRVQWRLARVGIGSGRGGGGRW